jgi:plasmid maintenance system antidote protein VapI
MILTADEARAQLRVMIDERYTSQAEAARVWGIPKQNLNDILQGRRSIPDMLLDKLGLERVVMYRTAV